MATASFPGSDENVEQALHKIKVLKMERMNTWTYIFNYRDKNRNVPKIFKNVLPASKIRTQGFKIDKKG